MDSPSRYSRRAAVSPEVLEWVFIHRALYRFNSNAKRGRNMGRVIWLLAGAIVLIVLICGGGVIFLKTRADGFSARGQPTALEHWAARQARSMALPASAKDRTNPVPASTEVLAEARAHWADHCTSCHANNGSGASETGKHMYPPAPDMR